MKFSQVKFRSPQNISGAFTDQLNDWSKSAENPTVIWKMLFKSSMSGQANGGSHFSRGKVHANVFSLAATVKS